MDSTLRRRVSLPRKTFPKILALAITICLLGGSIAPANPSCNAECCAQPKGHVPHSEANTSSADLLPDCCSDLETAPCPHMLESSTETRWYAIYAVAPQVNPATTKVAAIANYTILLPQPHHHMAASTGPPIRSPSMPLYLQKQTFLI